MQDLQPAEYDSYETMDETMLPPGNKFLKNSPLNRALGASGGGRRHRRRSARRSARRSMKKGGKSHRRRAARKSHRRSMKKSGGTRRSRRSLKGGNDNDLWKDAYSNPDTQFYFTE